MRIEIYVWPFIPCDKYVINKHPLYQSSLYNNLGSWRQRNAVVLRSILPRRAKQTGGSTQSGYASNKVLLRLRIGTRNELSQNRLTAVWLEICLEGKFPAIYSMLVAVIGLNKLRCEWECIPDISWLWPGNLQKSFCHMQVNFFCRLAVVICHVKK